MNTDELINTDISSFTNEQLIDLDEQITDCANQLAKFIYLWLVNQVHKLVDKSGLS
jgi:tRNA (Thr-GGU) A37 N-methylase